MRGNISEWIYNAYDPDSEVITSSRRQVEELEKRGKIKYYFGFGGDAFGPYEEPGDEFRYWDRTATSCNVGFRVCMYPNEGVSWKNYVPKH
jgi:hypothetical protein